MASETKSEREESPPYHPSMDPKFDGIADAVVHLSRAVKELDKNLHQDFYDLKHILKRMVE